MSIVKGLFLIFLFLGVVFKCIKLQQKLQEEREYFIKTINHDLKVSVIAQIRGLELLEKTLCSEPQAELVNDIKNSCKFSMDMLSMLVNSYEFENGKDFLMYKKTELSELIKECVKGIPEIFFEKGVNFSYDFSGKSYVFADEEAIKKAIKSLLFTSMSYATRDSVININTKNVISGYKVTFSYTGRGLTEEECGRMFSKKTKFSVVGHGIRMHLCKKIVEFHGGKIDVKNNGKSLNTFTFYLPKIKFSDKVKTHKYQCYT